MFKALKSFVKMIAFYLMTIAMYVGPVLAIVLFFDFVYDFQINLFDESSSFLRIILSLWIIIVHGAWLYVEFGDKIKKYF